MGCDRNATWVKGENILLAPAYPCTGKRKNVWGIDVYPSQPAVQQHERHAVMAANRREVSALRSAVLKVEGLDGHTEHPL